MNRRKNKQLFRDTSQGILIILGAILLALFLRIFLFASFKIPSPSMEPSIMAGDYIYVNKLIPGPRIYKNFDFLDGAKIEFYRIPGYRKIRKNDVLVFNYPYSDWNKMGLDLNVYYVKRCIAIPGDSFCIDNGIYKVIHTPDTLGCFPNQEKLSQMKESEFRPEIWNCFPHDTVHFRWTVKNFGPLYVPGEGESIHIDTINYYLYKHLIEYETDKRPELREGRVWLGEEELKSYTFRQNYYFMSGDYVFDSQDSRYWGLLPEDHIVGKAAFIWQSKAMDSGNYRWERFFKAIH